MNDAKLIDMVEVVRCKDCDLWVDWVTVGSERLGNLRCPCAYWSDVEDGRTAYTSPNDFCSYGECKEPK